MNRNKYDSFLIWLYNQNKEHLIPKEVRDTIPYSTIYDWRNLNYSSYVGHQVSLIQKNAVDQFEVYQEYKNLKRLIDSITRVWIQVSAIVSPILLKTKQYQKITMDCLQQLFTVLPKKIVFRLFCVSPQTFYNWLGKEKIKCGISPLDLCFRRHPLQLAEKEVSTLKSLFKNPDYNCWPAASIYYHALRNNQLYISLSTFYKYVNLLGLKRKWKKSVFENYHPLTTSKPNEFIHIDTTFWTLTNGVKTAIILVCDNFSKTIIGWNVSLKKDGQNAKAALQKAIQTIQKHHPRLKQTSLITDGGGENHNFIIEDFISNMSLPETTKLQALKDVQFSNSAIEAVNKIIKRYLRQKLPDTFEALIPCLKDIINDYNTVRPHGSLLGLTPMECYTSKKVNLDFQNQKLQAKKNRIAQNKAVNCGVCN